MMSMDINEPYVSIQDCAKEWQDILAHVLALQYGISSLLEKVEGLSDKAMKIPKAELVKILEESRRV